MEDVTDWFSSKIRNGVFEDNVEIHSISKEFKNWLGNRAGSVVIQKESPANNDPNVVVYPKTLIYFQQQEDLVDYLLTFDEIPKNNAYDAAMFYAPYIPLTVTTKINYAAVTPTVSFHTRYSVLNSNLSVYSPGDSDSSI
jgi:hypothetical protein